MEPMEPMDPMPDPPGPLYGPGARDLQERFDSRRLADRLVELTLHAALDDGDIALVRDQSAVWVATVDADGWPDVSYKGGDRGFVQVVSPHELRVPFFNGNGMWRTLGNVQDHGRVALLFVDQQRPWRMRVHRPGVHGVVRRGRGGPVGPGRPGLPQLRSLHPPGRRDLAVRADRRPPRPDPRVEADPGAERRPPRRRPGPHRPGVSHRA